MWPKTIELHEHEQKKWAKIMSLGSEGRFLEVQALKIIEVLHNVYVVVGDRGCAGVAKFCVSDPRNSAVGDGCGINSCRAMK